MTRGPRRALQRGAAPRVALGADVAVARRGRRCADAVGAARAAAGRRSGSSVAA